MRQEAKRTSLLLLLAVVVLLAPAWFLVPALVGDAADLLCAFGFPRAALRLAAASPVDEVSDERLGVFEALAELELEPRTTEDDTVRLWLPPDGLPDESVRRALTLLDEARRAVGAALGGAPDRLLVRAPRTLAPRHLGRFTGRFIDLRLDGLMDPGRVYHEVTHAVLAHRLFAGGLPTDLPPWFEEGLAEFLPVALGVAPDFRTQRVPPMAEPLTYDSLDAQVLVRRDYFPACTAVAEVADAAGGLDALRGLVERLRAGDHFVEALPRVTGLTEAVFARRWEASFNHDFVDASDEPAFLLRRAAEMLAAGGLDVAWVYVGRLGEGARESQEAYFLRARILVAEAERFRAAADHATATDRLRLALKALDRVTGAVEGSVALRERSRDLFDEERMRSAAQARRPAAPLPSPAPAAAPPVRSPGFGLRLVLPPALVLFLLLILWGIRSLALPLAGMVWDSLGRSGALLAPCLVVAVGAWFLKVCCGAGLTWGQLLVGDSVLVGRSGGHLLYLWGVAVLLWLVGGRAFGASGGQDPGGGGPMAASCAGYGAALGLAALMLWRFEVLVPDAVAPSAVASIHAVLLAFVTAAGQETFFRGGLFKSAELSLHMGPAAVLSSALFALWVAGPSAAPVRLVAVFAAGVLACGLVVRTGRLGSAVGAALPILVVDWLVLGSGGGVFGGGFLAGGAGLDVWRIPDGLGLLSAPAWSPVILVGWLAALAAVRRWRTDGCRTSRIFHSYGGY